MDRLDAPTGEDYIGNMAQVSVSLPADVQRHVERRAEDGGFPDPAAYLGALAQRDLDAYRMDVARVQALIDEGLASGVCDKDAFETIDEIIAGFRGPHG